MKVYEGDIQQDLAVVTRNGLAEQITGGLSKPSKMPEYSWGLPATRCKIGAVLAREPGTVCSVCYAAKGRYRFANVQDKLEARFVGLEHPLWVPAMVFLIRWNVNRFFRWFCAGDLQSIEHLQNICLVALYTRDILHWLPTREYDVVRAFDGQLPENLTIRVSAHLLEDRPPTWWPNTSNVISVAQPKSYECPSHQQGNVCGPCRACWHKDVSNVSYRLH